MTAASAFEIEFLRRRNLLREDTRNPESKRNETGNIWKYSLKAALESAGFTVVLEKSHKIYENGEFFDYLKSDISVYYDGVLIAVIESKDYFTIDYVRRAASELSDICESYPGVVGFLFQGRSAFGNKYERANKWAKKRGQDIEIITMIDQNRKKVNGKLQTTVNTDFDVKYDEVNKIVEKLNAIIQ
tara:strand:+ start:103 stop:663 length:561 start_codon:yes stop_codon:yes gene_type:complete